jgi:hypothetical protein
MAKKKTTYTKKKSQEPEQVIELKKEIPTSIISVAREYQLNIDTLSVPDLDTLYATVPEITRTIDLRGAAIIYRGYEIKPRNDSAEAKEYANLCSYILNQSGGVNFLEQWNKNTDLYGQGYVELLEEDGNNITELVHVSPYNFGYELEIYDNPETFTKESRIKLDKNTQKPVGFATYTYNEQDEIYDNDKKIPLEKIAHLKYKVVGDAIYGVSLIQPMTSSISAKLQIENSTVSAARLVSAPKIVIKGNFDSEEDAREKAREAASLDINDVVLLDNGDDFQFHNPGEIRLPELREIFITNITTASGIPRPLLTSESAEINKATLQELTKDLRHNMRSNMSKMKHVLEHHIFKQIGENYGINDFEVNIPVIEFPEDPETAQELIVREEKKAATLTSLSNSVAILNNMRKDAEGTDSPVLKELEEAMQATLKTYMETIRTFSVNNDQELHKIEEELPESIAKGKSKTTPKEMNLSKTIENSSDEIATFVQPEIAYTESSSDVTTYEAFFTIIDDEDSLSSPEELKQKHDELHMLYELVSQGQEITDYISGIMITLPVIIKKHRKYLSYMEHLGLVHEYNLHAEELDQI